MTGYRVIFQRQNLRTGQITMRVNPTVFYGKDIETVRILVAMAGCDKKGMILVPMDQLGEEYQVKPTRSAS